MLYNFNVNSQHTPNLLLPFVAQNKSTSNFTYGKLLGKGGFAAVHEVVCNKTGMHFALKKSKYTLSTDSQKISEDIHKTLKEISALSQIVSCSEHIVNCFDAWCEIPCQQDYNLFLLLCTASEDESVFKPHCQSNLSRSYSCLEITKKLITPNKILKKIKIAFYLLFELCEGTCEQYIFNKLPIQKALTLMSEAASGLKAIHHLNIIHRDIKPSNILIKDGKAKICDFGISLMQKKVTSDLDCLSTNSSISRETEDISKALCYNIVRATRCLSESYDDCINYDDAGCLPYMAAEALSHEKIDQRIDIYALGIVIYLMTVEFDTAHEKSMLLSKLKNGVVDGRYATKFPILSDLVLKMTHSKLEERPNSSMVQLILERLCKEI